MLRYSFVEMTDVSVELEIENYDEAKKLVDDLEARLNAQPTLETDVMDFLAIAGLNYWRWEPFRSVKFQQPPIRELYERLKNERLDRNRQLPPGQSTVIGYLCMAIDYEYLLGNIKTLSDFKKEVEESGTRIPHLSLRGIAYMNEIFEKYAIEPMTVPYASKRDLVKYGLTLTEHRDS